jgi:hypothetical protein
MECGVDPLPAQVLQVCQPDMAWIMESVTVAGENVVNAYERYDPKYILQNLSSKELTSMMFLSLQTTQNTHRREEAIGLEQRMFWP